MPKTFTHKPLAKPLPDLHAEIIDGVRYYTTPDNNVYPSITSVLSILSQKGIADWRKRVGEEEANRISESACNDGTAMHLAVEHFLDNKTPTFPTDKKSKAKLLFNVLKPRLMNIDNIVAQEVPLYSDVLGIAGRCDCIAEYNGQLAICDFKTSRKRKKKQWIESYFIQATAYSLLFEELTGIEINQIVILIAGADLSSDPFVEDKRRFIDRLHEVIGMFKQGHVPS